MNETYSNQIILTNSKEIIIKGFGFCSEDCSVSQLHFSDIALENAQISFCSFDTIKINNTQILQTGTLYASITINFISKCGIPGTFASPIATITGLNNF